MGSVKNMAIALLGLLPASPTKNVLLNRVGFSIDRSASIGPCLILGVRNLTAAKNSRIGPFNVFRDVQRIELGPDSVIGQWNWISASRELIASGGRGEFILGRHSAFTSRHYADVSGGIYVGEYTTIAGVRSTFVTHGIDWNRAVQRTRSIVIGDRCLISSNTNVAPGTRIGHGIVTGMGATLAGDLSQQSALYVQNRARPVKEGLTGLYFSRTTGSVRPE